MNIFELIAEERIKRAIADGQFENLEGKGKPQSLAEGDGAAEENRLANHILKTNGFTLNWIEIQQEIQTTRAAARKAFCQSYLPGESTSSNEKALKAFGEEIQRINRKIVRYNLEVPIIGLQYSPLVVENEIQTCLKQMKEKIELRGIS